MMHDRLCLNTSAVVAPVVPATEITAVEQLKRKSEGNVRSGRSFFNLLKIERKQREA
jgi:hypothetical protein